MSNERSNVAPKFRPHLFWREMEEVVVALKTKSCLSEASSFCLAETAEGIAKKVQPAVFLFVSVFLSAARKKNEKARGFSEKKHYTSPYSLQIHSPNFIQNTINCSGPATLQTPITKRT